MRDSTRARVAAVVAAAAGQRNISSVYDYSSGNYRNTSVEVSDGSISGFDFNTASHISGGGHGRNLDFYDYDTSSHVQLQLSGNQFSGFDHCTNSHFSGTVSGSSISLYDHETAQYYNFSF